MVRLTERFMSVLPLCPPQSKLMLTVTERQLHNGFYISISTVVYHITKIMKLSADRIVNILAFNSLSFKIRGTEVPIHVCLGKMYLTTQQ